MDRIVWREKWLILKDALDRRVRQFALRTYSPRDWVVLFLIAASLGAVVKSFANDRLTIGYDDYRLSPNTDTVDLNVLEKNIIANGGSFATKANSIPKGDTCTE